MDSEAECREMIPELFELYSRSVEQILKQILLDRRDNHVRQVQRILSSSGLGSQASSCDALEEEWQKIDSLSRLRGMVGGRFDNIKKKWLSAGLPLRAHRGDKGKNSPMKEQGWLELCDWINRQGFEARRSSPDSDAFFEIRPVERR